MVSTILHQLKHAAFRTRGVILLLLFSLPLGLEGFTNSLLAIYFLHSIFTFKHWQWGQAFRQPVVWVSVLFFIWQALSLLWSAHTADGFTQLETKMSFLLFPLLIMAQRGVWTTKTWQRAGWAFVMGSVMVLVLALLESGYKAVEEGSLMLLSPGGTYYRFAFTYVELASPFMHPGYLALHIGMALILVAVWWVKGWLPCSPIWAALICGFLFLGMVLLQGRAALLAWLMVVGVAGAVWLLGQKGWRGLLWILAPLLLLGVLVYSAPRPIKERYLAFPNFEYDISGSDFNTATYRLAEWRGAVHAIAKNPWRGSGAGSNWPVLKDSYRELHFWEGIKRQYNAHNQYLESTLIGGLIALVLLLLWLGLYIYEGLRMHYIDLLLMVLFLAITMLTESMLERAWAVILVNVWWPFLLARPPAKAANEL